MRHQYLKLLISIFLVVMILTIFWQTLNHEFLNYDDDKYVTENQNIQAGLTRASVQWTFTAIYESAWQPLVWISYMLDYEFHGLNPMGYHLTNLLFHLANTLLLFLSLSRMSGSPWQSGFVAAIFAIHPLHVESVAWIAGRKDVLSTFFWMLTIWAYIRFTERPGLNRYLLVILSFVLGLMTKPMLVTLPFVLMLLDWWPLGRITPANLSELARNRSFWKIIIEKIPLLTLAGASNVITYFVQQKGGSVTPFEQLFLWPRISNALTSYANYISKTIWPSNLAVFYPHQWDNVVIWKTLGASFLLVFLTFAVIRMMWQHPYLALGWFWFLGTLIPVIGLVQFGLHARADRFMYVPLIGLSIPVAWGIPELLHRARWRSKVLALFAGIGLSALMICSWFQVRHWRNSTTLFEHALNVTANNYIAHHNLGLALADEGKTEEALPHFLESLRIVPDFANAHNNLGVVYQKLGRPRDAIREFKIALEIKPQLADAHFNLGSVLAAEGKFEEALALFLEALRIGPSFAELHNNLGWVYHKLGRLEDAIREFKIALEIKPQLADAHYNLGLVYGDKGDSEKAYKEIRKAMSLSKKFMKELK